MNVVTVTGVVIALVVCAGYVRWEWQCSKEFRERRQQMDRELTRGPQSSGVVFGGFEEI